VESARRAPACPVRSCPDLAKSAKAGRRTKAAAKEAQRLLFCIGLVPLSPPSQPALSFLFPLQLPPACCSAHHILSRTPT
jgi:hypothetical protein